MRSLAVAMALLTAVDGATLCPNADNQPAPNVTTLLVSPSNDSVAWVLSPDCSLTTHFVTPDGDGTGELHCNGTDIKSIASLPSGAERLYLDNSYSLRSADFSSYNSVIHIILSYSGLTDVGTFKFPESLEELDFEGNTLSGIAPGVIPDKVRYLYLGDNALSSLSNFSLPQSLETLTLNDNQFTSINFELPSGLKEIEFSRNTVAAIENLTIPKTLTSFLCNECATRYFRGVELSPALEKLELDGSRLLQFEVRQSDLAIIQAMNLSIASTTTSCDDELATLQTVGQLAVCVIPDDYFEVKYPARLGAAVSSSSPAPDNGTTDRSSSSSTLAIVLGVVGGTLVLGIIAFIIHRTFRRRTTQSGDTDPDQKYRNAGMDPTLELPGSSSKATAASSSHRGSQEYLSNDVRNDEALIPFRIAYDEIQVVREIAKGGYGVIQLGRWRGRDVAIKQLLPEKCREMTVIKSFMDEIRLCSKLEHPKVVEFIGVSWSTLIDVAVISEFMAGGDLSLTLRSQQYLPKSEDWFAPSSSLPPKTLVALDVIEALVYLHSFNSPIIHRDLKARNVLLDCDGNAKLSDFGISREVSLDETMTGEVGTVAWIAPEVLQGERYSEKADIYSLGVLLSELDTCRHPYSHDPRDGPTPQTNTRIALLVSTGKLLPRLTLDCPASIHSLILSCLQYDASDRPSALEVHYELRKIHQQYTMGL